MKRDQYRQMWESRLEKQITESDRKRNDPALTVNERDQFEQDYQALRQQQDEWSRGGFWTEKEEAAYKLYYE